MIDINVYAQTDTILTVMPETHNAYSFQHACLFIFVQFNAHFMYIGLL